MNDKCDKANDIEPFLNELKAIAPIRMLDPLIEALGALTGEKAPLSYTFTDVVKLEGHACPTTACAFECCRAALKKLYSGELPVRGEIEVTIYGAPDDGVYGVFGHVMGYITGAAPETGFKGLGTLYRRKDLLTYENTSPDPDAMCFRFRRKDSGRAVLCRINHDAMPRLAPEKSKRMLILMPKVLWEAATPDEMAEFHRLWIEGVMLVFQSAGENNEWLKIKEID